MTNRQSIESRRELEFAVFCIENVAATLGKTSGDVYRALSDDSGILHQYSSMPSCLTCKTFDRFYKSQTYELMRDGVSDMHFMSDEYLVDELVDEYPSFNFSEKSAASVSAIRRLANEHNKAKNPQDA